MFPLIKQTIKKRGNMDEKNTVHPLYAVIIAT